MSREKILWKHFQGEVATSSHKFYEVSYSSALVFYVATSIATYFTKGKLLRHFTSFGNLSHNNGPIRQVILSRMLGVLRLCVLI